MPAITTIHESLPYIDPDPTPEERAAAEALIAAERAITPDDPFHALLPPVHTPTHTPLIQAELDRIASSNGQLTPTTRLSAIDFTRYEAPEPPNPATLASLPPTERKALLNSTLSRAHASHAYVSARRAHLALLDGDLGRNAWLIGNMQLEGELRAVEKELAATRHEIDLVAVRRRAAQEEVGGEMGALQEAWRRGVGRVLETEVAAEGVRREVLEARRRLG